MKIKNHLSLLVILVTTVAFTSCKTSFDEIRHSDGNANFSKVIALGGSHLAGYSDRALYLESQTNSIPAILNTRFSFAGGGSFRQPLVNSGVGIGINGNARYALKLEMFPCNNNTQLVARPVVTTGDASNFTWLGNLYPFNNLSVPNTRVKDVSNQTYGNPSPFLGNPFYARFASNPGSSTMTGDALINNPTFIIVWLGIEDIYNYARLGGEESNDSITSAAKFEMLYQDLIDEISSQSPGGVLLNIPALTSFPFFTAMPYNGLVLSAQQAAQLNALYASVDSTISFSAGNNNYVIADPSETSGRRHIKQGEYILQSIPVDSIQCQGWGTTVPIPERYVLDEQEVLQIKNAVISYNATITVAAVSHNLAIADMNTFLLSLNNGILFNGVHYSSDYLTGGVYSTEGFYFTQRGNALVANEVIEAINNFYGAKLPKADANAYPGLVFP